MLFADEIVLHSMNRDVVECKAEKRREALGKITYKVYYERDMEVRPQGEILKKVDKFKYRESMVTKKGEIDEENSHRVQSGWRHLKKALGVFCNKRII